MQIFIKKKNNRYQIKKKIFYEAMRLDISLPRPLQCIDLYNKRSKTISSTYKLYRLIIRKLWYEEVSEDLNMR